MNYLKIIKRIFSKAIVTYALAALVLAWMADYKSAIIDRLNQMAEFGNYPGLFLEGNLGFNERDFRMSIAYYKLVVQLFPQNDGPYAVIGFCYAQIGDIEKAIKYYKSALFKAPNHFWYDYNLGLLYLRKNEKSLACQFFQKVIHQDTRLSIESTILAPLNKISPDEHQMLFSLAVAFAMNTRESAYIMLIKLNLDMGMYKQAYILALTAAQDPSIQNKNEFISFAKAAGMANSGHRITDTGCWEKYPLILHPWIKYIQAGKEMYF